MTNDVFKSSVDQPMLQGQVVDITPQMADNALKLHNSMNPRKRINMNTAHAYAKDMKSGNWVLNGEPIVIDADGNIKNGQHRLMAIVLAGVTVKMFVVSGVAPEITTFDMGTPRKVSQELRCGAQIETVANMVVSNCKTYTGKAHGTVRAYILEHRDEITDAVNICMRGKVGGIVVCAKRDVYTVVYLMLRNGFNREDLSAFINAANTGFPIDGRECSAAVVLANFLRTDKSNGAKNDMLIRMQTVYLAYRDFATGKKRMKPYKVTDTSDVWELLQNVRKMDGLE